MKSMTGFGRGCSSVDGLSCTVEIKTVNARYLDVNIRCPSVVNRVEPKVRQILNEHLYRGKVEMNITISNTGSGETNITVNESMKAEIQRMLVAQGFYPSVEAIPLQDVLAVSKDWLQVDTTSIDEAALLQVVTEATTEALHTLVAMREAEGDHLHDDILSRVGTLEDLVTIVDANKVGAVEKYRTNTLTKIRQYLNEEGVVVDEDRFIQEIALLADKTDITEEIVRFRSHVVQLKNTLEENQPMGRKLDFLVQELNREVNTMGSKAMHTDVTDQVVQLKCELEKIREQIQNIE